MLVCQQSEPLINQGLSLFYIKSCSSLGSLSVITVCFTPLFFVLSYLYFFAFYRCFQFYVGQNVVSEKQKRGAYSTPPGSYFIAFSASCILRF